MRSNLLLVIAVCFAGTGTAAADLVDEFAGFEVAWEIGVSGLRSSYDADTQGGLPISGAATGSVLPMFGPERISYPGGIGEVPSPGGSVGAHFDQGALGVKVEDGNLVLRLAIALDPQAGYYHEGWQSWYGQGDLFVTVDDSTGISHFAMLDSWARDGAGVPHELNGGHFNAAQAFHVTGGAGGASLEGHLIHLNSDSDITLTGGSGAYTDSDAPVGLDMRTFAEGGSDLGSADLQHDSLTDLGQTWYVETWTTSLDKLSPDSSFELALHASPSCGNDQIGGVFTVPEPASALLVLMGFGLFFRCKRSG